MIQTLHGDGESHTLEENQSSIELSSFHSYSNSWSIHTLKMESICGTLTVL